MSIMAENNLCITERPDMDAALHVQLKSVAVAGC
jgi:hypothetical protein